MVFELFSDIFVHYVAKLTQMFGLVKFSAHKSVLAVACGLLLALSYRACAIRPHIYTVAVNKQHTSFI
ncbi:MAG TPA: hypothetical protein DC006_04700 [Prevotellaceae bacterium]|nr:hypothetical protein [Prevotellaceae bacterium]